MELPDYWMSRPEAGIDGETAASFDRLLDRALDRGSELPIDYQLDAPKWQFLCHAADRADVVLHGSGDPDIHLFEPRQPEDPLEFSNRRAVFAATDGIWPMYYAILDRDAHPMRMLNATIRVRRGDQLSVPYYFFSISRSALEQHPWRCGTVYLLAADSFETQPPMAVGDSWIHIAQAASAAPVRPMAKMAVGPDDFPFLHQIRGHDDDLVAARMAEAPGGFPWVDDT